jgi:outer membrane protein OmpA-like peptidoglycan-associated protein
MAVRAAAFAFGMVAAVNFATAAFADCPPLGTLPNYMPGDVIVRPYDAYEFKVRKGDDSETVNVLGRTCQSNYDIKQGVDVMSDLEIQSNYRAQLKKLGAEILFDDDRDTYARLSKDGKETWLYVYSQESSIEIHTVEKAPLKLSLLPPSGKDYRLLGHMPNYLPDDPEKRNFDKDTFKVKDGDDTRDIEVRGAKYHVTYNIKDGAQVLSDVEIQENYRAALRALGAQILFTDGRDTSARAEVGGQTIWLYVYSQETGIEVTAVEEKPFQASIKAPEASALKQALDKNGRVALYVNFDFAKAALKPDAAPVIAQVVKLLKDNPSLKLSVDGHTDNIGGHDYNVKLSEQRAAAVVQALVAQGIARERLKSAGYGPDKPIADNSKEEGRSKNRRVELVKG